MLDRFSRTELLLGADGMEKLKNAKVAIFGIGGVGSYAAEALCRSGIYNFALFDDDRICLTNINRQIIALTSTIGRLKIEVMKERMLDINPQADIEIYPCFYTPENADEFPLNKYSYIIDAIDTVTAKLELIVRAYAAKVPIISCMGAGNKLDATKFEVADITETSVCPLAKVMRKELKTRNIEHLKVVYSKEPVIKPEGEDCSCKGNCVCPKGTERTCTVRRQIPGSTAFVPSVAGFIIAGEVIKDIIKSNNDGNNLG